VNHVVAVLGFAAVCVLWFVVQRWAGGGEEAKCDRCEQPGCAKRAADPDSSSLRPTCPTEAVATEVRRPQL
jgi:hypothetical protein